MTIAAMVMPRWVTYSVTTDTGDSLVSRVDSLVSYIGLYQRCTTMTATGNTTKCIPFSEAYQCSGTGSAHCAMWRSAGFLMSLAVVVELAAAVGFVVVLAGGKARRETRWRLLGWLVGVVAGLEFGALGLVVRFFSFLPPPVVWRTCWHG
jgi:hypothetical protein